MLQKPRDLESLKRALGSSSRLQASSCRAARSRASCCAELSSCSGERGNEDLWSQAAKKMQGDGGDGMRPGVCYWQPHICIHIYIYIHIYLSLSHSLCVSLSLSLCLSLSLFVSCFVHIRHSRIRSSAWVSTCQLLSDLAEGPGHGCVLGAFRLRADWTAQTLLPCTKLMVPKRPHVALPVAALSRGCRTCERIRPLLSEN